MELHTSITFFICLPECLEIYCSIFLWESSREVISSPSRTSLISFATLAHSGEPLHAGSGGEQPSQVRLCRHDGPVHVRAPHLHLQLRVVGPQQTLVASSEPLTKLVMHQFACGCQLSKPHWPLRPITVRICRIDTARSPITMSEEYVGLEQALDIQVLCGEGGGGEGEGGGQEGQQR